MKQYVYNEDIFSLSDCDFVSRGAFDRTVEQTVAWNSAIFA